MVLLLLCLFAAPSYFDYCQWCQKAVDEIETFATFKSGKPYNGVLEHVSYEQGVEYLQFILAHYPDLVQQFDAFRTNDLIGGPVQYPYGEYGLFSPSTLRYIKTAGDLRARFGDLRQMHIVEIGGGYGGQCKILADLCGFASYTIFDLAAPSALQKKYLSQFGVEAHCLEPRAFAELRDQYDLLISNYALGEIGRREQESYYPVIHRADRGYVMGIFPDGPRYHPADISQQELHEAVGSSVFTVENEEPRTGEQNILITWQKSEQ